MNRIAVVLVCLACAGHGRRVQPSGDHLESSPHAQVQKPLKPLDATDTAKQSASAMMPPVLLGSVLGLVVGASMVLGAILVFVAIRNQPKTVLSATQYFSSGILIAVIGQELLPDLEKAAEGVRGSLAIAAGFAAGVFLMYAVEYFLGEEDDKPDEPVAPPDSMRDACIVTQVTDDASTLTPPEDDETPRDELEQKASYGADSSFGLRGNTPGLSRQASPGVQSRKASSSMIVAAMEASDRSTTQRKRVPWTMTLPIFIDAIMDGMLIGVMSATSAHSAVMLAVATAVEMGFLGITFGALVMQCGPCRWLLVSLLPLVLGLSGAAGAASASALAPVFEAGITAFGISALLFLACNELLKEACENGSSIFQSGWLFIGFLTIVLLGRALPEEHAVL